MIRQRRQFRFPQKQMQTSLFAGHDAGEFLPRVNRISSALRVVKRRDWIDRPADLAELQSMKAGFGRNVGLNQRGESFDLCFPFLGAEDERLAGDDDGEQGTKRQQRSAMSVIQSERSTSWTANNAAPGYMGARYQLHFVRAKESATGIATVHAAENRSNGSRDVNNETAGGCSQCKNDPTPRRRSRQRLEVVDPSAARASLHRGCDRRTA